MTSRLGGAALALAAVIAVLPACRSSSPHARLVVDTTATPRRFDPITALGAGVDGQDRGAIDAMYAPANLRAMRSAGFKPLTYRLRTELADEAWHWNPQGSWSDAGHTQGYWTSSATPGPRIELTYGYRLPRRGNTHDQANDNGYSRLDDGDASSFWKSDPYLDAHFAGDATPQWVVVDLGRAQPVDAVRLEWGTPYAVDYRVEWWDGDDPFSISAQSGETWRPFPRGAVNGGTGGDVTLKVGATDDPVRFVRVLMTRSSEQAPPGSTDVRDALGYALREISVGTLAANGQLHDLVRHGVGANHQSAITVSSTDPWHRSSDVDMASEQPGFDKVLTSGLTNDVPMLVPAPLLFGTPEDAQTEVQWLASRRVALAGLELGEEPDGQNALPEDYGRLYAQWARAVHAISPDLKLGGPSFQTGFDEVRVWPDTSGETSWLRRFAAYLRSVGQFGDLAFLSVEWYPFDDACAPVAAHLRHEPRLLAATFRRWAADGLADVPKVVSEYGYSAFAAEPEVDVTGALVNTDFAAQFVSLGGSAAYFYGYEPNTLLKEADCNSWGNTMLLQADDDYAITDRMPAYFAARLLTQVWAEPVDGEHDIYPVTVDAAGTPAGAVTAYAVRRPDGRWAVLVLNKDPHRTLHGRVAFRTGNGTDAGYRGVVTVTQYGRAQYRWQAAGEHGHPTRDSPPVTSTLAADAEVTLPPYSMTVVAGGR